MIYKLHEGVIVVVDIVSLPEKTKGWNKFNRSHRLLVVTGGFGVPSVETVTTVVVSVSLLGIFVSLRPITS